jgi:hypothetical protein
MEINISPEAVSLNDAKIIHMDWLGEKDILLGFSNGATVRLSVQLLKKVALVCAEEIVYPDGTTS